MINPTQEVKKYIHKHACRDIEICYEPGKTTMTKQDEEFLAAYISLYDFQWKMNQEAERLSAVFSGLKKKIEILQEKLTRVTATFNGCCAVADKLSDNSYLPEEANIEKLTECQQQTNTEIQDYHAEILIVYEEVTQYTAELNKYTEADEEEAEKVHEAYNEISHLHSMNWENNAIDIMAFEVEFERFHSYKSVHEDRRRSSIDRCDEILTKYDRLNLETTAQYKLWTEFIKRCNLLRAVANLHGGALGGSVN